jgi:radical SAM protein with 4Fe4S-binding SPASM domain
MTTVMSLRKHGIAVAGFVTAAAAQETVVLDKVNVLAVGIAGYPCGLRSGGKCMWKVSMMKTLIKPRYCQWDLTSKCNLRCSYCRASISEEKPIGPDLSRQEALGLIDQLFELGVKSFCLAGGEPLMYPHIEEVLSSLHDRGAVFIVVLTNGTLINERNGDMLLKYANRVQISLDGARGEINDLTRGKGSYERILRGIRLLVGIGVGVSIRMTCSTQTVTDVIEIVEFAKRVGALEFDFRRALPVARAARLGIDSPNAEQYRLLCEAAWKKGMELGLRVELGDPFPRLLLDDQIKNLAEQNQGLKDGKTIGGCSVGTDSIYIAPDGKVLLCPYLLLYCGDIRSQSISEIWENSPTFRFFRSIRFNLRGKCRSCELKYACGGCRAVALALTNDILAEDQGCWH